MQIQVGLHSVQSMLYYDFISGLGYRSDDTTILSSDCHHILLFYEKDPDLYPIQIYWNEKNAISPTYSLHHLLQIEITPRDDGLFNIVTRFSDQVAQQPILENLPVTKKVLPLFIRRQLYTISLMISSKDDQLYQLFSDRANNLQKNSSQQFYTTSKDYFCATQILSIQ